MDYKVISQLVQKFRSHRKSSRLVSKDGLPVDSEEACSSNITEALSTQSTISYISTIQATVDENTLSHTISKNKKGLLISKINQINDNNGFEEDAVFKDEIDNRIHNNVEKTTTIETDVAIKEIIVNKKYEAEDKNLENQMTSLDKNLENQMTSLDKNLENQMTSLDKNLENQMTSLDKNVENQMTSLDKNLDNQMTSLDKNLENQMTSLDKNLENQMTSLDKNLENQMTSLLARLDRLETRLLQLTRVQSLADLIGRLHMAFSGDQMEEARVQCLMEDYESNVEEWRRYAKFNKDRYTRNLVDEGNGKFNLILLCWSEGQISSVHDHAQSHCFMKMLQGSLTEVRYREPKPTSAESANLQPLAEISRTVLNENDVCYINDSIGLHKVGNCGPHPAAVSLHLYSPPFDMCSSFDPQTGQKSLVQMSFYSKFGEEQ